MLTPGIQRIHAYARDTAYLAAWSKILYMDTVRLYWTLHMDKPYSAASSKNKILHIDTAHPAASYKIMY